MSAESLVKMANQIGQFFASETDTAVAVRSVQQHLQNFWTPAMRHELSALQTHNLHPLVKAALASQAGSD